MSAQGIGLALLLLGVLLYAGKLVRLNFVPAQKLFLPASIIGGVIGLLMGPDVTGLLVRTLAGDQAPGAGGLIPADILGVWSALPGLLISVVFATLLMGEPLPRFRRVFNLAGPQLAFGLSLGAGQGLNSTPVQLGGERQVVLRVKEHQQARQQSLEDVRESVRADLRAEQAAEQAQAAAEQALERIKGGQTVLEAGQDTRADVKEAEWVTRSSDSVPAAVLSGAFGLPESAADSPDGVTLADMGARGESVVKLLAVEEAEPDEVLSNNPTLVEGLRSRRAGSEYAAFMAYLRNNFEVEIMEDRVN